MKNKRCMNRAAAIALASAIALMPTYTSLAAAPTDTAGSNATVNFTEGSLTIGSTPSYSFGEHSVPSVETAYTAEGAGSPLVINDARGTGTGWQVNVELSGFTYKNASEEDVPTLAGTYIQLKNGDVAANGGTIGGVSNPAPVLKDSTFKVYAGGSSVEILNAAMDSGRGSWATSWSAANVSLIVPPGDVVADTAPTAILTWSLEDTPA